jgi:TrmH family RNA methyltransferase
VTLRVSTRNARFQQWQALLLNRTKRQRAGEFLVQGVRPITLAIRHGWPVRELLHPPGRLSTWAGSVLDESSATAYEVADDMLRELGDKAETPELLAVVALPEDDLTRVPVPEDFLGVVFDRPSSPGNIGTVIRSADAFGVHGVIVTGHAADPYDPQAVRASTGSIFAVPVVRVPAAATVTGWLPAHVQVVGTDENGDTDLAGCDLTGPTLLVIGNETAGMSAAWRDACDRTASIPIGGSASSLNAATAAGITLYEAARQRLRTGR